MLPSTTPARLAVSVAANGLERHLPGLLRYLRVLGADAATAEDLAQEAFVVLLERGADPLPTAAATFGFLRATARHRWLHHTRRTMTRREVEHADEVWDRHCEGEGDDYVEALRQCVGALPPRSRRLLEATYGRGLGRDEAARELAISGHGVKSALRRLRALLHDCIERRRRNGT